MASAANIPPFPYRPSTGFGRSLALPSSMPDVPGGDMVSAMQAALQDPAGQQMFKDMARQMGLGDVDPQSVLNTLQDPRAQSTMAQIAQGLQSGQLPADLQSLMAPPSTDPGHGSLPPMAPVNLQQGPYGLGQLNNPVGPSVRPQASAPSQFLPTGLPQAYPPGAALPGWPPAGVNPAAANIDPRLLNRVITGTQGLRQQPEGSLSGGSMAVLVAAGILTNVALVSGLEALFKSPQSGTGSLVARAAVAVDKSRWAQSINGKVAQSLTSPASRTNRLLSRAFGVSKSKDLDQMVRIARELEDPVTAQRVWRNNVFEVFGQLHEPNTTPGRLREWGDRLFNPQAKAAGGTFQRKSVASNDLVDSLKNNFKNIDAVDDGWLNEGIRRVKADLVGFKGTKFTKALAQELQLLGPEGAQLKAKLGNIRNYSSLQDVLLEYKNGQRVFDEGLRGAADKLLGNLGKKVETEALHTLDHNTLATLRSVQHRVAYGNNFLHYAQKQAYHYTDKALKEATKLNQNNKLGFVGESVVQFFSGFRRIFSGEGALTKATTGSGGNNLLSKMLGKVSTLFSKGGIRLTFPTALIGLFTFGMPLMSAAKAENGDKTKTFFHHFFGLGLANLIGFDLLSRFLTKDFVTKLPAKLATVLPKSIGRFFNLGFFSKIGFLERVPMLGKLLVGLSPATLIASIAIMFVFSDPIQKLGEKVAHMIFGKPKSVQKEEDEAKAKEAAAKGQPPLTPLPQDQLQLSQRPQALPPAPVQAPEDKYPLRHFASPADLSLTPEAIAMSRAAQRDATIQNHVVQEGHHLQELITG